MTDVTDPAAYVADEIRSIVQRVRGDVQAGCCTPERLEANLRAITVALADLAGDAPVYEVTPQGILELHAFLAKGGSLRKPRSRPQLQVIQGDKS